MLKKIEYGDFQTPKEFTEIILKLLKKLAGDVNHIIEPTCGIGNFIESSINIWNVNVEGYEINKEYFNYAKNRFSHIDTIKIYNKDIFKQDFRECFSNKNNVLIIGNPLFENIS